MYENPTRTYKEIVAPDIIKLNAEMLCLKNVNRNSFCLSTLGIFFVFEYFPLHVYSCKLGHYIHDSNIQKRHKTNYHFKWNICIMLTNRIKLLIWILIMQCAIPGEDPRDRQVILQIAK